MASREYAPRLGRGRAFEVRYIALADAPELRRARRRNGESVESRSASGGQPVPSDERGWHEAREILWDHRRRLLLGFGLLLLGRLAGFVLPASSKYLLDEVIGKHRGELLVPLALAVVAATCVQALTAFTLSQVLGVSAQRSIMEARRALQRRVMRLPIRYFDSQKTGVLIARIMSDAEGVRNLVGTGLVQLASSVLTALIALTALLYLNWRLTSMTLVMMG